MTTQLVTFKMERKALEEIDAVAKSGFYSRTEFIKAALRDKVDKEGLKEAMMKIAHLKGAAKRKTTEEEYEKARNEVFDELHGSNDIFRRLNLANIRK
ncbi:MAG: ribbon-helix-helix domain-containing protein [Candidatus Nanoarchaeia archaeon]|nr:ribbon-helix-helix domain-containing protein [Candidatus Nanoarchaeia archaeon]